MSNSLITAGFTYTSDREGRRCRLPPPCGPLFKPGELFLRKVVKLLVAVEFLTVVLSAHPQDLEVGNLPKAAALMPGEACCVGETDRAVDPVDVVRKRGDGACQERSGEPTALHGRVDEDQVEKRSEAELAQQDGPGDHCVHLGQARRGQGLSVDPFQVIVDVLPGVIGEAARRALGEIRRLPERGLEGAPQRSFVRLCDRAGDRPGRQLRGWLEVASRQNQGNHGRAPPDVHRPFEVLVDPSELARRRQVLLPGKAVGDRRGSRAHALSISPGIRRDRPLLATGGRHPPRRAPDGARRRHRDERRHRLQHLQAVSGHLT